MTDTRTIRDRIQDAKDNVIPRKLGYVKIPLSEEDRALCGVSLAYLPLKYAKKFGLEKSGELDTFDYAAATIKHFQRTKPLFDGIIYEPVLGTIDKELKAMSHLSKKFALPVSAYMNGKYYDVDFKLGCNQMAKNR